MFILETTIYIPKLELAFLQHIFICMVSAYPNNMLLLC